MTVEGERFALRSVVEWRRIDTVAQSAPGEAQAFEGGVVVVGEAIEKEVAAPVLVFDGVEWWEVGDAEPLGEYAVGVADT